MSSAKWRPFCLGLNVLRCTLWAVYARLHHGVMMWKLSPYYWAFWEEYTSRNCIPLTKSQTFGYFFVSSLNTLVSKQSNFRWFQTPWRSRHCNGLWIWCARMLCLFISVHTSKLSDSWVLSHYECLYFFYTKQRYKSINSSDVIVHPWSSSTSIMRCTCRTQSGKYFIFFSFGPGIVVACVCVCVCVCLSVNHESTSTISARITKFQRCKRPWLRSLLFWEVIDLDVKFNFEVKIDPCLSNPLFITYSKDKFGPQMHFSTVKIPVNSELDWPWTSLSFLIPKIICLLWWCALRLWNSSWFVSLLFRDCFTVSTPVDMENAQPVWNGDSTAEVKRNHHIDCFTVWLFHSTTMLCHILI